MIADNRGGIDHRLTPDLSDGEPFHHRVAADPGQEARVALDFVTDRVRRHGLSLNDCAVLFREGWQAKPLEEAYMQEGIPYRVLGAPPPYLRVGGRDLLAYLRFVHNPADAVSLRQVLNLPPRGINARTRRVFMEYARDRKLTPSRLLASLASSAPRHLRALSQGQREALASFARTVARLLYFKGRCTVRELAGHILEITGLDAHTRSRDRNSQGWANILEVLELCRGYGDAATPAGLRAFLDHMALVDRTEEYATGPEERITLSTLQLARGTEFECVAMVGLNEGALPSDRSRSVQEERRLCYVGMTRARRHLLLTRSRTADAGGAGSSASSPSWAACSASSRPVPWEQTRRAGSRGMRDGPVRRNGPAR